MTFAAFSLQAGKVVAVNWLGYPLGSLQSAPISDHCAYAAAFAIPALDRLDVSCL